MNRGQALKRIRKLRALRSSSNEHESEAAAERMHALMVEHKVLESEVKTDDELVHEQQEHEVSKISFGAEWRLGLLTALTMRYGCKAIRIFEPERIKGAVIGPKKVADQVIDLFRYFDRMIGVAARSALAMRTPTVSHASVTDEVLAELSRQEESLTFVESYCAGVTMTLQARILSDDDELTRSASNESHAGKAAQGNANEGKADEGKTGEGKAEVSFFTGTPVYSVPDSPLPERPTRERQRVTAYNRQAFELGRNAGWKISMTPAKKEKASDQKI